MRLSLPLTGLGCVLHSPAMSAAETSTLYETDFIAWAEAQAAALRAVPDPSGLGLDLQNLIEEVESLARQDLFEFEDRIRTALTRLILAAHHPDPARARAELAGVSRPLIDARGWRSPTGLARLDPEKLWSEAREEAAADLPDGALQGDPTPCPFRLEDLLARGFDPREARSRVLRRPGAGVDDPGL